MTLQRKETESKIIKFFKKVISIEIFQILGKHKVAEK